MYLRLFKKLLHRSSAFKFKVKKCSVISKLSLNLRLNNKSFVKQIQNKY